MWPKRCLATFTLLAMSLGFVMSSCAMATRSVSSSARAWSDSIERAVAMIRSPRRRASRATLRPKPHDAPVKNHGRISLYRLIVLMQANGFHVLYDMLACIVVQGNRLSWYKFSYLSNIEVDHERCTETNGTRRIPPHPKTAREYGRFRHSGWSASADRRTAERGGCPTRECQRRVVHLSG